MIACHITLWIKHSVLILAIDRKNHVNQCLTITILVFPVFLFFLLFKRNNCFCFTLKYYKMNSISHSTFLKFFSVIQLCFMMNRIPHTLNYLLGNTYFSYAPHTSIFVLWWNEKTSTYFENKNTINEWFFKDVSRRRWITWFI